MSLISHGIRLDDLADQAEIFWQTPLTEVRQKTSNFRLDAHIQFEYRLALFKVYGWLKIKNVRGLIQALLH